MKEAGFRWLDALDLVQPTRKIGFVKLKRESRNKKKVGWKEIVSL